MSEELIMSLLDGVEIFFKNYCKLIFNEDSEEAKWNYDSYFRSTVNSAIESIVNPLGLDWFDDID